MTSLATSGDPSGGQQDTGLAVDDTAQRGTYGLGIDLRELLQEAILVIIDKMPVARGMVKRGELVKVLILGMQREQHR